MKTETFVLQVKGSSMIEEGIMDGDFVLIEEGNQPKNGDIVVALLKKEGLATLKKYYKKRNQVTLVPANSLFTPIARPIKEVEILGICTGVIRKFK